MTPEQSKLIAAWLRSRGPASDCRCGGDDWSPQEITGGAPADGSAKPRMLILACRHCGFTKLVSARAAGV